jgi:hypothetical protein
MCRAGGMRVKNLGWPKLWLEMEVQWDRESAVAKLSQKRYIQDMLVKFNMELAKASSIPIDKGNRLTAQKDAEGEIE